MRSQYLTLLCILTFLSCAWGLSDAIVSFVQADAVSETLYVKTDKPAPKAEKQSKAYFEDRSSDDVPLPDDPARVKSLAVAQFVYVLLTLVGAILMFQLRRVGLWVYGVGVLVGLVLPVAMAGLSALNTSFGVFFSVLFAGLYWVARKEMR